MTAPLRAKRIPILKIFCRETRHKTLEEIAAAFGDKVVEVGERDVEAEGSVLEEKAGTRHVERTDSV